MQRCKYCTGKYHDDYLSIYKNENHEWNLSLVHIEDCEEVYETIVINHCPYCGKNLNFIENIYFSDLDNTLIYSKQENYKCVEQVKDRKITYMTDKSYNLLQTLLKMDNLLFVPCTMRTFELTTRIDLFKYCIPELMVCTNGTQIYLNSELDLEWDFYMRNLISRHDVSNLKIHIDNLKLPIIQNRNIEGFYIQLKFNSIEDATNNIETVKLNVPDNYQVVQIKTKVYLMNEKINKANAILYLKDKYTFGKVYASGDSEPDRSFTGLDFVKAYLPNHASFTHSGAYVTSKNGIESTELILNKIIKDIECK